MFARLGNWVARHWVLVILAWVAATAVLRFAGPRWSDIAQDGNFVYLPETMASVAGERLMAKAFPDSLAKSQIALVLAREDGKLTNDDVYVASDIARRFRNFYGAVEFQRGKRLAADAENLRLRGETTAARAAAEESGAALENARKAFDEAIRLDEALADYQQKSASRAEAAHPPRRWERLAAAYYNRGLLTAFCGRPDDARDRETAVSLDPQLGRRGDRVAPDGAADWPLLDVWTWHDDVFGEKLIHDQARLVILQLANELIDTDNIRLVEQVEAELRQVRQALDPRLAEGLIIGFTGSAAVGGDLLRSAKATIEKTEVFTVLFVVLILAVVYRSPLLVAVPLAAISISLVAATSLTSLLTRLGDAPGFGWWDLKVFTTTKVFIVVILFGAGTDYCLFLIARYKECLNSAMESGAAIASSLAAVGDALAASALTTIVGLSMMIFADFGKFRHTGPVIGLCLAVTLAACVTLTPALLRACDALTRQGWLSGLGRSSGAGWRFLVGDRLAQRVLPPRWLLSVRRRGADRAGRFEFIWRWAAGFIVAYPGRILIVSVLLLLPLGLYGLQSSERVTFDFLNALDSNSPSRQGADVLRRHFPVGEGGPLTVLIHKPKGGFGAKAGREQITELSHRLYISGVTAVRNVNDPLGEFPPGTRVGILHRGLQNRLMRAHRRTERLFISTAPGLAGDVTRLELILRYDPFSIEAAEVLSRVEGRIGEIRSEPGSHWRGARFLFTGTTAAIRDLRTVTQSDNVLIQRLVVLAVLGVLLVILKRPIVCLYLIVSVLFSYYVTIGATELFFQWAYGGSFQGLEWRTPLFLFVILVAVGQDYNVYLVTRVFEEQSRYGPFAGLRRAVVRTGGIITSCGVIMAGTFLSMTSGTWGHLAPSWMPLSDVLFSVEGGALRGIVELGFALALGVTLDTFVVRPLLVPAFLALLCRWRGKADPAREEPPRRGGREAETPSSPTRRPRPSTAGERPGGED